MRDSRWLFVLLCIPVLVWPFVGGIAILAIWSAEYITPRWVPGAKPRCEWLCAKTKKPLDRQKRRL